MLMLNPKSSAFSSLGFVRRSLRI